MKLRESELPGRRMFLIALSALPVAAAIVAALVSTAAAASPADDISAIREVEARQAEAWNSHDARAYSNLFTAGLAGTILSGRVDLTTAHTKH